LFHGGSPKVTDEKVIIALVILTLAMLPMDDKYYQFNFMATLIEFIDKGGKV
jgi:hypothetical protein